MKFSEVFNRIKLREYVCVFFVCVCVLDVCCVCALVIFNSHAIRNSITVAAASAAAAATEHDTETTRLPRK